MILCHGRLHQVPDAAAELGPRSGACSARCCAASSAATAVEGGRRAGAGRPPGGADQRSSETIRRAPSLQAVAWPVASAAAGELLMQSQRPTRRDPPEPCPWVGARS
jgi:hypothetical protein